MVLTRRPRYSAASSGVRSRLPTFPLEPSCGGRATSRFRLFDPFFMGRMIRPTFRGADCVEVLETNLERDLRGLERDDCYPLVAMFFGGHSSRWALPPEESGKCLEVSRGLTAFTTSLASWRTAAESLVAPCRPPSLQPTMPTLRRQAREGRGYGLRPSPHRLRPGAGLRASHSR